MVSAKKTAASKNDSDEEKPEVRQVYQGKFMREDCTFFEKLFFTYAKPLLESSKTQQIVFE